MPRPREFDEPTVARAARDQFQRTGYAGTSISDLTQATRLGRSSLYGAFGDKHRLFLRALDDYCDDATSTVAARLQGPDDSALQRLQAYVRSAARGSAGDAPRVGCMLASSTAELAGRDAEVAACALGAFRKLEAAFASCIGQAQRHGDIDATADPRAAARTLLATLRGIESLGKAGMTEAELGDVAETAIGSLRAC